MKVLTSKLISNPDCLVVGAGISGLLSSALKLKEGKSVQLVEKLDKTGGRYSPEQRQGFTLGAGFSFGDAAWWGAIADRLGISSSLLPVNQGGSLCFGPKGWLAPEDLPAWESYFARANSEYPSLGLFGVVQALQQYCSSFDGFSLAPELPVTGVEVEEGRATVVRLGADATSNPKEVHWATDYKTLLETLQGPGAPAHGPERVSWLKKFRKTQPQPAVVIELAHKGKVSEFTENLLLPFSHHEKEERRYLTGAFVSNRDPQLAPNGFSLSSWILPLSENEWGDNHETMKKIRSAKRMLEKAFPQIEKNLFFERVLVLDSSVSPLSKKKGDREPLLENMFLAADWAMPGGGTIEGVVEGLLR